MVISISSGSIGLSAIDTKLSGAQEAISFPIGRMRPQRFGKRTSINWPITERWNHGIGVPERCQSKKPGIRGAMMSINEKTGLNNLGGG